MRPFSNVMLACLVASGTLLASHGALGHSRWMIPSHSVLSGEQPEVVTVDISISNDFFHPDYSVGGIKPEDAARRKKPAKPGKNASVEEKLEHELAASTRLRVFKPGGASDNATPLVDLARKSSGAVLLEESGTYRFSVEQDPVYFTWYTGADGKKARAFGRPEQIKSSLPKDAKELSGLKLINRIETFVTRNGLSRETLKASGKGLELNYLTHPNELFAGEKASFEMLLDGKPLSDATIKVTRGNTRYRNQRHALELTTNDKGRFDIEWPQAGLYLLESEWEQPSTEKGIENEVLGLFVTLEVNPE